MERPSIAGGGPAFSPALPAVMVGSSDGFTPPDPAVVALPALPVLAPAVAAPACAVVPPAGAPASELAAGS